MLNWETKKVKDCIIVVHLFVLLSAFSSAFWQVHGLFGENGILPVAPLLECAESNVIYCRLPLLQLFVKNFHLSPSVALQLTSLIGILLSSFAIFFKPSRRIVTFAILFLLYQVVQEAGNVFYFFQWDSLLLESTAYIALLAWFDDGPADSIAIYGILSLSLRLMFSSGVVKLQSLCPTWWKLTALHHHYQSQPIPTPLAWYAHHMPHWFKQLSVLSTFFIEIILPPFFVVPIRPIRQILLFSQVFLMVLIMLTGNYTFFNINTMGILLSLLDAPKYNPKIEGIASFVFLVAIGMIVYVLPWNIDFSSPQIDIKLLTNPKQFDAFVQFSVGWTIWGLCVVFGFVVITSFIRIIRLPFRFKEYFHFFGVLILCSSLFAYGTIPLASLDRELAKDLSKQQFIMSNYKMARNWNIANSYGLFRSMTGTNGRPEVVIEGATKLDGPWKEISFHSKAGQLDISPPFVVPHQPRLDWQMWFAALGTYQQNPFFLSLVHHLMENTTSVVQLISDYPFRNKSEPMNFVKATLYMYHFTDKNETNWWKRDFQEQYLPVFNKNNEALVKYLQESRILPREKKIYAEGNLGKFLREFHKAMLKYDQRDFVWIVVGTVFLIYFSKRLL